MAKPTRCQDFAQGDTRRLEPIIGVWADPPWVYGQWSLSLEAGNILKFQQKIFSRIYYIFRLFLTAFSVAPTPPKLVDSQSAELCYDSHTLLHLLILKLLILSSSEMKFSAMSALVHRRGTHANAP